MVSTIRIYNELVRCINIRYTLIELYIDSTILGVAHRTYSSIKDIMTLYALEKSLYNAIYYNFNETDIETLIFKIREYIRALGYKSNVDYFASKYPPLVCVNADPNVIPGYNGGTIVINKYIVVEGDIITTIIVEGDNIIKNAIINEGDVIVIGGNTTIHTGDTIITQLIGNTEWKSKNLVITSDGQTTIPDIGFDIANVDIDTIRLEVQGDDSVYSTTGDGYHIVGSTLYWHHFYDLKIGMQVAIKWRE